MAVGGERSGEAVAFQSVAGSFKQQMRRERTSADVNTTLKAFGVELVKGVGGGFGRSVAVMWRPHLVLRYTAAGAQLIEHIAERGSTCVECCPQHGEHVHGGGGKDHQVVPEIRYQPLAPLLRRRPRFYLHHFCTQPSHCVGAFVASMVNPRSTTKQTVSSPRSHAT